MQLFLFETALKGYKSDERCCEQTGCYPFPKGMITSLLKHDIHVQCKCWCKKYAIFSCDQTGYF